MSWIWPSTTLEQGIRTSQHLTPIPRRQSGRRSPKSPLYFLASRAYADAGFALLVVVIAGGDLSTGFASDNMDASASAGIESTTDHHSKFVLVILDSTLLRLEDTHRWLKAVSYTANLTRSMGAPWDVVRCIQPISTSVTDVFTKADDSVRM